MKGTAHSKHASIVAAIRADIAGGKLRRLERMPPARALAQELGIAVGTAARAYREAAAEGLIRSEVGRGTYVLAETTEIARGAFGRRSEGLIDLAVDFPLESLDPDLAPILERLAKRSDRDALLRYPPHEGSTRARAAGLEWVKRSGLENRSAEEVIVCGGGQHALVVALACLGTPQPVSIFSEALTYPGLREAAEVIGARLLPIEIDQEGMVPEALEAAAQAHPGANAVYLIPSLHNPTTAALPAARREAIVETARRHNLLLIEDDVHRLHADSPAPPLALLAPERTFFIASLSKTVAAGLRVAYLIPPKSMINRAVRHIHALQWALPPLMAEIATCWIEDGTAEATLRAKGFEAEARQSMAGQLLGERARICSQRGSFYTWIDLPIGSSGERLALAAARAGVGVLSDVAFRVGSGAKTRHGVRVCLGAAHDRNTLRHALLSLAGVLDRESGSLPGVV